MSRLTSLGSLPPPHPEKVAAHNYRRVGERVLISNESGRFALLRETDYRRYLAGLLAPEAPLGVELRDKGFLRGQLDLEGLARESADKNLLAWEGPNVHTVVVTRRCNFKCLYCHASVAGPEAQGLDMSLETARRTVDFIFQSPSPDLMLEFQGGEPLLNWPAVRFVCEYARKRNKLHQKRLHLGLISNFSLLDDEKLDFLAGQGVSFCTSLDGPEDLHNRNRLYLGGNSHAHALSGLRRIQERRKAGATVDVPNAICTVTRFSLPYPRQIVDQLVELGLERVQLGPLDPIGYARRSWGTIGYTSREYVEFYRLALDHIIGLNRAGVKVYEKMGLILLLRILRGEHWRFPNGDGLCRLAYNHDGAVYPSEEGRLIANEGDPFFKVGDVASSSYAEVLDHPAVRAGLLAGRSECQPMCFQCAYQPYCTVLPVYNYRTQGSVWGQMPSNGWCEKMMGIFDVLFEKLADPDDRKVLESWMDYRER